MNNPFYLQEIPQDAPFCNRNDELRELESYAKSRTNVVIFSPRRYGKTSLVKRVQGNLAKKGAITIYADLFGVSSIDEIAGRFAKAVFAVTHRNQSLWKKAIKIMRSFRPVLKPDIDGSFTMSVEPISLGRSGIELLEDTMDSISEFIKKNKNILINITLDEFQEIVILDDAKKIEAIMRSYIQTQQASYFFVGSRRRILLGIFNDRQRPFFQSALNYPLKSLPKDALTGFIVEQFKRGGYECSNEMAERIGSMVEYHPYYSQKLSFFVFEISKKVTGDIINIALEKLLNSEKPVYEAISQGLSSQQRLLLQALSLEPTKKILSNIYIRKYNLGSIGGIQHSLKHLIKLDLVEKDEKSLAYKIVDPIYTMWIKNQREERLKD